MKHTHSRQCCKKQKVPEYMSVRLAPKQPNTGASINTQVLTRRAFIEGVVVDTVAGTAEADADPVLDVLENVVVDVRVERF